MRNSIFAIAVALMLTWNGIGPDSRWVSDGCGDLEQVVISLLDSELSDTLDAGHVAPAVTLVQVLTLDGGYNPVTARIQYDTGHFPYSIRAPPGFHLPG